MVEKKIHNRNRARDFIEIEGVIELYVTTVLFAVVGEKRRQLSSDNKNQMSSFAEEFQMIALCDVIFGVIAIFRKLGNKSFGKFIYATGHFYARNGNVNFCKIFE